MLTAKFGACLLISLPQASRRGSEEADVRAGPEVEDEQALAIALNLREAGCPVLVVCWWGGWAYHEARRLKLPHLAVRSWRNPLVLLKLWHWQRRRDFLLIQTVGEGSVSLGHFVQRWRKPGASLLAHAFFLTPPSAECRRGKALWAARKILCGSGIVRGELAGVDPGQVDERLVLLAPGVNPARYAPPRGGSGKMSPELAPEPPIGRHFVFGMGSGLVPHSGALVVVRAMAAMWQVAGLPPWEVRITGSGPCFAEVLEEAERLGVASRLCLLGDQAEVDFLAACDVWLAPGSSSEERPDALWAGFAAGLPVICSGSALHVERLEGGEAALMVEPDDPQSLASAMIELMTDSAARQNLLGRSCALGWRWDIVHMAEDACGFFAAWRESAVGEVGEVGRTP